MRAAPLFWTVAALAALGAAGLAWTLRWTCDDAYISFRYAQHLVEGHGLRFNLDPQEAPVEGYTNFAWTIWLALGMALGCTRDLIETWAAAWGSLLHGATVWLLAGIAWRWARGRGLLPVAALGYAAHHHAASLAPAGLETALFVFLGTAMVALCLRRPGRGGLLLLGLLGVLAAMTRPDGALFGMAAGIVVLVDAWRARAPGLLVAYVLPLLLCLLPFLLWRHAYYGQWVPNTFFAKAGGDPYPSQGFAYVWQFAMCYRFGLLAVLAAALFGLVAVLRSRAAAAAPSMPAASAALAGPRRALLVLAAFALPYLAFVVWVGGDFMFARFLLPVLPLVLLLADVALARAPRLGVAFALLVAGGMLLRCDAPWLRDAKQDVSDNREISVAEMDGYPGVTWAEGSRAAGRYLRPLFAGLDVRLGIAGSHANLAYRAEVPVAIECAGGLTDAYIAHLPAARLGKRGHGHGWRQFPQYLLQRGVHFMFDLSYETGNGALVDAARPIIFPSTPVPTPARIVVYDRKLMSELRRRDPRIQCVDFERALDDYIAALPGKQKGDVARDLEGFRAFYFDHNEDPARLQAITAFLGQ